MSQENQISTDPLIPSGVISLEAHYVVQYWDNWAIENGKYVPATKREYKIHSGPYDSYLAAVLAIIEISKRSVTGKYDILKSVVSGKVLGFDLERDHL